MNRVQELRDRIAELRRQGLELAAWDNLAESGHLTKLIEAAKRDIADIRGKYGLVDLGSPQALLIVARMQGIEEHAKTQLDFLSGVKKIKIALDAEIAKCEEEIVKLTTRQGERA